MRPGPDNERTVVYRVLSLDAPVCLDGAVRIRGIEPPGHVQYRDFYVLQQPGIVSAGPVFIIVRVVDDVLPYLDSATVEILVIELVEGAGVQIELIIPVSAEINGLGGGEIGVMTVGAGSDAHAIPPGCIVQAVRTVVVVVIPNKSVEGRSLWRYCLQCRVRADHGHGRVPSSVGDAPLARTSVIAGNIFKQPIKGVVRVSYFVAAVIAGAGRAQVLPHTFRFVSTANILENKYVTIFQELHAGGDAVSREVLLRPVWLGGIGCADKQERVFLRFVLGAINHRMQQYAIRHGDFGLCLVVMRLDVKLGVLCKNTNRAHA